MSVSGHQSNPASLTLLVPYTRLAESPIDQAYKVYNLSPALLTAPYFLEQFQHSFSASSDGSPVIVLQHTVAEHFDVYEHWLLTTKLLFSGEVGEGTATSSSKQQAKTAYDKLLHCCSLACILGDHIFLDALATQLILTLRQATSSQSQLILLLTQSRVEKLIADVGVHSGLFRLVAHAYARFATVDEIRVLAFSNYNTYFKNQVLQSMANMRIQQHVDGVEAKDFVVGPCYYHTHGFYEACTLRAR